MQRILSMVVALLAVSASRADVFVDRAGNGVIGHIEITGQMAVITVPTGKLAYALDNVMYLSNDPQVTSYLGAYHKASKQGAPAPVLKKLLELSFQHEPANRKAVQQELAAIRQAEAAAGKRVIAESRGANVVVPITVENSNFRGFIDYGTKTTVNGGQVVYRIPQPLFENVAGSTTIILGTGGKTITTP
jgi:hypothetical protein